MTSRHALNALLSPCSMIKFKNLAEICFPNVLLMFFFSKQIKLRLFKTSKLKCAPNTIVTDSIAYKNISFQLSFLASF